MNDTLYSGDVVKARKIEVLAGAKKPEDTRFTYNTLKGYRFVFLLLGVENDATPLDPKKAMDALGWQPKKIRKAER